MGQRSGGVRTQRPSPRRDDRPRAPGARRRLQLHAGARSRLRDERGDRRPCVPRRSGHRRRPRRRAGARTASGWLRAVSASTFPGHGYVAADSHVDTPIDDAPLDAILRTDIVPFAALIQQELPAIMPAHVVYPAVDAQPAGFSRVWIERHPARTPRFDGLVFSDDLEMAGAHAGGRYRRARGCGGRCGLRRRARLQRLQRDGRSARALVATAAGSFAASVGRDDRHVGAKWAARTDCFGATAAFA